MYLIIVSGSPPVKPMVDCTLPTLLHPDELIWPMELKYSDTRHFPAEALQFSGDWLFPPIKVISDVPDNGRPDSLSVNMSWTRGSSQPVMDMQHKQEINTGCLHGIKSLTPSFDVGLLISFKPYHSSFSSVAHPHKLNN